MADEKNTQAPEEQAPASENGAPTADNSALAEQAAVLGEDTNENQQDQAAAGADSNESTAAAGTQGDAPAEETQDSAAGESQDSSVEAAAGEGSDQADAQEGEERQPAMVVIDSNAPPVAHKTEVYRNEDGSFEIADLGDPREGKDQVLEGQENKESGLPVDTDNTLIESGLDLSNPADADAQRMTELKLSGEEGAREEAKFISPDPNNANTGPGTGDVLVAPMLSEADQPVRKQDPEGTGKEQVLYMEERAHQRVAHTPMGVEPFTDYVPTPHKVQSNGPADRPEPNKREHPHDFPGERHKGARKYNEEKGDKYDG